MIYNLGGNNLKDLGLIAGQADSSNIALVGAWNWPIRDGKTHHEWHDCIEPYLREDEIFFAGRDLQYHYFIQANSRQQAIEKSYALFDVINAFDELVPFGSDEFGYFDVYVKQEIKADYLDHGYCKGVLTMRQPVVDLDGDVPAIDNLYPSIDNISLEGLGIKVIESAGEYNRPAAKDGKFTIYGREGFKITKQSFRTIQLKLMLVQPSYALFNNSIKSLYAILSAPNARFFDKDGIRRECFAKDGFKVYNMWQQGNAFSAMIELNLTEIRVLTNYNVLGDASGNILTDGNGVPLSEIFKQQ